MFKHRMSTHQPKPGLLASLTLRWYLLLERILHWWVKSRALPDPISDLELDPGKPVCYAIDTYALTSILILDRSCRDLGLPRPLLPLPVTHGSEARAYCALRRKEGLLVRRTAPRTHSEMLKRLVDRVCESDEPDIQIIPVTVLVGRAPDRETGLAKIFFSESWEIGGRMRRLLSTFVNGRSTFVQFGQPVSLRELASKELGAARSLRKVARILRVQLSNARTAAIGPDLSHRRTVIDGILLSPAVEKAIDDQARADNTSAHEAWGYR